MMVREVEINGRKIVYSLQRKKVKNINLRIKPDLSVNVSANKTVSTSYIDKFVVSKGDFILNALNKFSNIQKTIVEPLYTTKEFSEIILKNFNKVADKFAQKGIAKPTFKMRKMKSRWGSCNYTDKVITLSTHLIYCTEEQIYYVIVHEFSHLIVPNHSKDFYNVVSEFCPDYKEIKKELNKIIIR